MRDKISHIQRGIIMKSKNIRALACVPFFLSANVFAETQTGIYIAPSVSYQNYGGNILSDDFNIDSDTGYSVGVGYSFESPWSAELVYTDVDANHAANGLEVETSYFHLDGLYEFSRDENWTPFAVLGLGQQTFEVDTYDEEDVQLNAGWGLKYIFNEHFAIRADLRATWGAEDDDVGSLFNAGLVFSFGSSNNAESAEEAAKREARAAEEAARRKAQAAEEAARNAARAAEEVTEDKEFNLSVKFKNNSSVMERASEPELAKLAEFLIAHPKAKVVIEGHSDSLGNAAYNKDLSKKRAEKVMSILRSDFRINAMRMRAVGFGEENPIADNATSEGRSLNRRVVAKVKATSVIQRVMN